MQAVEADVGYSDSDEAFVNIPDGTEKVVTVAMVGAFSGVRCGMAQCKDDTWRRGCGHSASTEATQPKADPQAGRRAEVTTPRAGPRS